MICLEINYLKSEIFFQQFLIQDVTIVDHFLFVRTLLFCG